MLTRDKSESLLQRYAFLIQERKTSKPRNAGKVGRETWLFTVSGTGPESHVDVRYSTLQYKYASCNRSLNF